MCADQSSNENMRIQLIREALKRAKDARYIGIVAARAKQPEWLLRDLADDPTAINSFDLATIGDIERALALSAFLVPSAANVDAWDSPTEVGEETLFQAGKTTK